MRHVGIVLTFLLVTALSVSVARAAADRIYACSDSGGSVVVSIITPNRIKVSVDFPGSDDGKMTLFMDGGGDVQGGFLFADGEYQVAITGAGKQKLTYLAPDFGSIDCVWQGSTADNAVPVLKVKPKIVVKVAPQTPEATTSALFPIAGRSCGGIMREAPSMDTAKVASLKAGAAISILEQAGPIDEQGYAWFKIKTGSKTGYQWGGILSVATGQLGGAFVGC